MNQLTIIEYSPDGYKRTHQQNEVEFYKNLEPSIFKFFTGEGDVRTFGFVLNNDKNNYFQELLTDTDSVEKLNSSLGNKLSLIFCEPNSENDNSVSKTFEYAGKLGGVNNGKIWSALSKRILDKKDLEKDPRKVFPILFLLKIKRINKDGKDYYQILDSFYHTLKQYESYNNFLDFKSDFLNFVNEMTSNLSLIGDENLYESESKFKEYKDTAKKYAVIEVVKISVKKAYESLSEFLEDILENIDITDLF